MSYWDEPLDEELPNAQRTQYPRAVAGHPGWEEIGITSYEEDIFPGGGYVATGMLPTGNNLYAALQKDIRSPNVTLQMYGYISSVRENSGMSIPKTQYNFYGDKRPYATSDSTPDARIWFSRTIGRDDALAQLQVFNRAQFAARNQELFLDILGQLTGFNILRLETIRVIPNGGYRQPEPPAFAGYLRPRR